MMIVAFLGAAAPALIIAGFIGVLAFIAALLTTKHKRTKGRIGTALGIGLIVTLLVFGGLAMAQAYTVVEYRTVGLVVRFGELTGQVFTPGLHWKTPFIDRLITVPTVVLSYETSDEPSQSASNYTDIPITAQTTDGQQIKIKYTVLFHIPGESAVQVMNTVGDTHAVVQNVVKAYSRNLSRLLAQNYTAAELYSGQGIFDYEKAVRESLKKSFRENGIVLDDFLVRKVDFSTDYVNAIEQKQIAQQAIETAKYHSEAAEYEKERQIRLSEADAKRITLLAQADADRQRLLADSEAYSIRQRGAELQKYPAMVQWEFVRNLQNVQWGILPGDQVTPLMTMPNFQPPQTVTGTAPISPTTAISPTTP